MKLTQLLGLTLACCLVTAASPLRGEELLTGEADAPKTCSSSETCSAEKLTSVDSEACVCPAACGACKVKSAMKDLPKMTYLVGKEETCCSKSAAAMAKSSDQAIHFMVGDEQFDTKDKAFETLVSKTEEMVNKFTTPSTCHVSGNTSIAGKSCHCPIEAGAIAKKVHAATQLVSMKYKVGEETCSCPNAAKAMAKAAGEEPTFCVDGTETQCAMTARLNLARAKYKAAILAIAKAEAPADAGSES